jgi:hypothetical protein
VDLEGGRRFCNPVICLAACMLGLLFSFISVQRLIRSKAMSSLQQDLFWYLFSSSGPSAHKFFLVSSHIAGSCVSFLSYFHHRICPCYPSSWNSIRNAPWIAFPATHCFTPIYTDSTIAGFYNKRRTSRVGCTILSSRS